MSEFLLPVKGMRDFNPEETLIRRTIENQMKRTLRDSCFQEIILPTIENVELITRRSGNEIKSQLFNFTDKGKREVTLRPEMTLSAIRFFLKELRVRQLPLKLFYFGNCFRYEEPQSGRYREFWQLGAETIGSLSPASITESIMVALSCLNVIGLQNYILRLNNLDKQTQNLLDKLGIKYVQDDNLKRGLDYYNSTVFEIDLPNLGAQKQICGGGVYDLSNVFNVNKLPCVGFAFGFDRIILGLEKQDKLPLINNQIKLLVTSTEDNLILEVLSFASYSRQRLAVPVMTDTSGKSLKKVLDYANSTRIPYVAIIGEDEVKNNYITIKHMESGIERKIPRASIQEIFSELE